jgi:hypothetical protein
MYGIQPMPPSERATLSAGNRSNIRELSRSTVHIWLFSPNRAMAVVNGASGATVGAPPEPKCRQRGRLASSQMRRNRSQWSVWKEGRPRAWGISVNETALAPFPATRVVSATVASMSQKGTRTRGI